MKIVMRNVEELKFREVNPRKISKKQAAEISDSLNRFGFVNPIVVNSKGSRKDYVVGGHQRLKIAKEMGIKEVPVYEVSLDRKKEDELCVRLNQTADWDIQGLMENFEQQDLLDWGFEEKELIKSKGVFEKAFSEHATEKEVKFPIMILANDSEYEAYEAEKKKAGIIDDEKMFSIIFKEWRSK